MYYIGTHRIRSNLIQDLMWFAKVYKKTEKILSKEKKLLRRSLELTCY